MSTGEVQWTRSFSTCYRGKWPDYSVFRSRQHILPATEASDRIIPFQTAYSTCYRGEWPDYSVPDSIFYLLQRRVTGLFCSRQHILPAKEASDRTIPFQTAYSTWYRGEWPDYSVPDSIFYLLQRRVTGLFHSRQHILPATEASDRIIPYSIPDSIFYLLQRRVTGLFRIPFQTAYFTCYRGEWPNYSVPDSIFYLLQRRVTELFHSRRHILPATEASDRIIPFQTLYFTCYRGEWPDYSIPDSQPLERNILVN